MTDLVFALLLSATAPLHEHAFRFDREAEAVAAVTASCERCDWGVKGREAVVLALAVDGVHSQDLVLFRGAPAEYRVMLGPLGAVNRIFGLGPDDAPGPSLLDWSAGADLRPDGSPVEIPIVGRPAAGGAGSVPAAVPLAFP